MVVPSLPIEMLVILNFPVPVGFVISTAFVAADVSSKTDTNIVCKKLLITLPFLVVVNGKPRRQVGKQLSWTQPCFDAHIYEACGSGFSIQRYYEALHKIRFTDIGLGKDGK